MKSIMISVGCTIAVLSTSTTAIAHPISIYVVEESVQPQFHTVPPATVPPSSVPFPGVVSPYTQPYTIPVHPTLPKAPITPTPPRTSSFIWPYAQEQTIPINPTYSQPSSFIWPYAPKQTTTLSETYSTYPYRYYPFSHPRIIYINPYRSQSRETIVIYNDPTYP